MDGTVNVSILQWEQQRKELSELSEKCKNLEKELVDSRKEVKLTICDKQTSGYMRYNRYSGFNEYIPESKIVENVEFKNLEVIRRSLYDEAKHIVQDEINNHEADLEKLNSKISVILKNHESEIFNINKTHDNVLKNYDKKIEKYKSQIEELQNKLQDKEEKNKMLKLEEKLNNLENENKLLKNQIEENSKKGFFQRIFT